MVIDSVETLDGIAVTCRITGRINMDGTSNCYEQFLKLRHTKEFNGARVVGDKVFSVHLSTELYYCILEDSNWLFSSRYADDRIHTVPGDSDLMIVQLCR